MIMFNRTTSKYTIPAFLIYIIVCTSCTTISTFNQHAYIQAVDIKVECLNLTDKATNNYTESINEIKPLLLNIEKAYEFEKGRPKNEITVEMWDKLKDPNKDLFGGFLKLWETKGILGQTYIVEKKSKLHRLSTK